MKIALLGATGFVGRTAAAALAARPDVRELLLVDYDIRAAKKFAKSLSPKCRWAMADAGRTPDLERLLHDVDAVASAVGPCFDYEKPILLCCAGRKRPAASIGDGPIPGADRRELHDAFRRAGVAAVSGCGLLPGWTELLARHFLGTESAAGDTSARKTRGLLFWSPERFGGYAFFRRMSRERGPEMPAPAGAPGGIYRETRAGDLAGMPTGGSAVRRAAGRVGALGTVGLEFSAALLFWLRGRIHAPEGTPAAAAGLVSAGREGAAIVALIEDPEGRLPGLLLAETVMRLAERSGDEKGLLPLPEVIGRKEAEGLAEAAGARIIMR
ncbi:MAG: saccharopine dehydrogenase NADP-binding domain-containing protein [Deltaproteobacteria bacterium]|nr:saccharopine dehydrogenase NADP-binding domain-containing protein [Deltaproteobacteria bacterium]